MDRGKDLFASTAKETTGKRCRTETPPQLNGEFLFRQPGHRCYGEGAHCCPVLISLKKPMIILPSIFFPEESVFLQEFPVIPAEHRKHYWIRGCLNWCCFSEEK